MEPNPPPIPGDEGPLNLAVAADTEHGVVRIGLSKPAAWIAMGAQEARELACAIHTKACELNTPNPGHTAGEVAYNAYCETRNWKAFNGDALPDFNTLSRTKPDIACSWETAARAVLAHRLTAPAMIPPPPTFSEG